MRVLAGVLLLVCISTQCFAKCVHYKFINKVMAFSAESMNLQIKMSREFKSRKRSILALEQYNNVQACINRLSIYCDSVSIFFESMCAVSGVQRDRIFDRYGLGIIMTFRGGRVVVIETKDRVANGLGTKIVAIVDQYVELLDEFIKELGDELSSI